MLPGQHIAVVGRTGSGKSSLVMSLFRMLETVDGCVKIDGEDVAKLPLSTHRARLNIIPQVSKVDSSQIMFAFVKFVLCVGGKIFARHVPIQNVGNRRRVC